MKKLSDWGIIGLGIIGSNLAMNFSKKGFKLLERAPGVSVDEIKAATAGNLIVEGAIPEMNIS